MRQFCTLLNAGYITRLLALHDSLLKTCREPFALYILCMDDLTFRILSEQNLSGVVLVQMEDFETDDLRAVRGDREDYEYCWTCTSHFILHVLMRFGLNEVTYLDADLYFFHDPAILLEEFQQSGGSILLTEHRFTPETENSESAGIYCVQFMTFKADENGVAALRWWGDRCLEWCYATPEPGRFGDQKYVERFPELFDGIHVAKHPGGGVACWNVQQFKLSEGPTVNGYPVVFYHFTQLTWDANMNFNYGTYRLPYMAKPLFYEPYQRVLEKKIQLIKKRYADEDTDESCYFDLTGALR
ncbi:MAG TPA: glycosyl transferase [Bacilli bacterium]